MAKNEITDYSTGIDSYLNGLYNHLHSQGGYIGLPAEEVMLEKVRLRGKEFNTIQNRQDAEWKRLENAQTESDYRIASNGGIDE